MYHYSYPEDTNPWSGYGGRRQENVDSLFVGGNNGYSRGRLGNRRNYQRTRYDDGYPRLCEVCHTSLANAQQYEAHCAGKKHIKKLKKLSGEHYYDNGVAIPTELTEEMMEEDKDYIDYNPTTSIRSCTLCYVDFTSNVMEESHRTGKRHLKNVKYARQGLLNGQTDGSIGKCEICDVLFTSPTQKLSHLNGRRHEEECRLRGIPLRPTKRSNVETNETRASKRLKIDANKGKDSYKEVGGPTWKVISSEKTYETSKRTERNKTDIRNKEEGNILINSAANSPRKSKTKSQTKIDSFEFKNKAVTESHRQGSFNSKSSLQQVLTKGKVTQRPVGQETKEEYLAEEEPLLPHQFIEKESDEAYEKYTQNAGKNPELAQVLYDEYREIYKRYEVAYQEYLDNLNLDDMS